MAQAILVVDDSVTSRMITQATLSDAGWSVVLSTDGAQALNAMRAQSIGLIVTDWTMPGMDGAAFLAALRADPDLAGLPVLVFSAEPSESAQAQAQAQALGANAWLSKTVEPGILVNAVALLLGQPEAAA
ncbi:MAG: response regulator [Burkholderiaceae bacterium]|nr:response regulator [Burkholderiaceae bacterium]